MYWSRATLATIEAAPTQLTIASPSTTASMLQSMASPPRFGQRSPSTITCAGAQRSASSARRMASIVACRMLIASISQGSDQPIPNAMQRSRILPESSSRTSAHSALESAMPRMGRRRSRITAAATTGPASGPRPASSTPAVKPRRRRSSVAWRCVSARLMPVSCAVHAAPGWPPPPVRSHRAATRGASP